MARARACGGWADVYRRGEPGEPETLDPQQTQTVVEADIVYDLFEGLLSYDAEGRLAPGVATAWTVSDDGLTYSFDLREEDLVERRSRDGGGFRVLVPPALDPATGAPYASLFFPMKTAQAVSAGRAAPGALGVRALGPHRLEIALERPTPYFLGLLAHQTAVPLHRASLEKYGAEFTRPGKLVGNGAYVLTDYRPGDKLTLDAQSAFPRRG